MAITVSIAQESKTSSSIKVRGDYSSGGTLATSCKFYRDGSFVEKFTFSGTTSVSKWHESLSLSASTSYKFTVHFYDSNGSSLGSDSITITTDDPPDTTAPYISIVDYSTTDTSIWWKIYVEDGGSGLDYVDYYIGTTYYATDSTLATSMDNSEVTYSSLSSDTSYTVKATVYDVAGNSNSVSATYKTGKTKPAKWYWTTGEDVNGHKISGGSFSMANNEWEAFKTRVNDFRYYVGLTKVSWSYTATSGGTFYAKDYNQVASAVVDLNPYSTADYTSGTTFSKNDSIKASYFNDMMDCLNYIS